MIDLVRRPLNQALQSKLLLLCILQFVVKGARFLSHRTKLQKLAENRKSTPRSGFWGGRTFENHQSG